MFELRVNVPSSRVRGRGSRRQPAGRDHPKRWVREKSGKHFIQFRATRSCAMDPGGEAGGAQRADDLLHMLAAAGLQHEIDLCGLQRQIGESALVVHFLYVGIGLAEAGRDRGERAGQVAQLDRSR